MSLSIRLSRIGRKGIKAFRIVVSEARSKRDGKSVEIIGSYNPSLKPPLLKLNQERLNYWLKVGAKPTEAVKRLIK
jgi:small subunit ribosomal protein S16